MTKNYYFKQLLSKVLLLFGGGLFLSMGNLNAQISGTVSLGTGGTYTTWESLASTISTSGIGTGGLTVNVISNLTSTNMVSFSQNATNPTTSSKLIKINGNGFTFFNSNASAAFDFNGMDYVTLENLTIDKTGTSAAQSVMIFRAAADYNTIQKCTLQYSAVTTGSTAGGAYIAFSNSTTSVTTNNTTIHNGSFNNVENCLMRTINAGAPGPTYGITVRGGTSIYANTPSNNTFANNRIQNFFFYGIYMYYTNGDQFLNNDISRDNANSNNANTSLWLSHAYFTYGTNRPTRIDGNNFHDLPFKGATTGSTGIVYGFYGYYNYGTSSNYFSVSNNIFTNIVCNSTNYTTFMWYNYWVNMSGNRIQNWRSLGTSAHYGFYTYFTYNDFIFNNNIYRDNFTKGITYFTYHYFPTTITAKGNKFCNNTTADGATSVTYGLFIFRQNNTSTIDDISENLIDSNTIGATGYLTYLYYINGRINRNQISNNRMFNANNTTVNGTIYGLFTPYFLNMQCNNNLVVNNTGTFGVFGFYGYSYVTGGLKAELRQNTIQIDGSKSTYAFHYAYGMYFYPYYHTEIDVAGNIIDIQNSYSAYPAYTFCQNGTSAYKRWDFNSYFVRNITNQNWYSNAGNTNDFNGWKSQGFAGVNEYFTNPEWENPSKNNYRSKAFENQNNVPQTNSVWPLTPINNTFDLVGNKRNSIKSDRGALEGYMNITTTSSDFTLSKNTCSGTEVNANIYIKNTYTDTIYGFNVAYSVNGGPKTLQFVSTKILPEQTEKIDFKVPVKLNTIGNSVVKIFLDASDDLLSDDTLNFNTLVLPAPGGSLISASTKATKAIYQPNKKFDLTVLNQPLIYDLSAPRSFINQDFNSASGSSNGWQVSIAAYTKGNRSINGANFTPPTSTQNLEISFQTNDSTLEDSTITLAVKFTNNANGCDTIIKRDLLLYPSIKPNFVIPSRICDGDLVLFENKSTVRSGSMDFLWEFGTGKSADTSNAPEPVFQFPAKGNYSVKLIAKTLPYGFAFSKIVNINVNEIPNVQFNKTNACEGQAIVFTNNTTPNNASVTWDFGNGTKSNKWAPQTSYKNAGAFTVTLSANLNGCNAVASQKVYQFDRPKSNFALKSGVCDNQVFQFDNFSFIGNGLIGSYWDFDDNNNISTERNPSHRFSSAGTKKVKLVSVSEFGCSDTMTKSVSVKESPKVSFINSALCSVKPTTFTNTTPTVNGSVANYKWDFGDGNTSTDESPIHDWKAKLGPKNIRLTIELDNGCKETNSKTLIVYTQPKPSFQASDVCSGESIVFVNNTTWAQGEVSYKWDFGDGTISTNSDPTKIYNTNVTLTPNITLYAYIKNGCADSITQKIVINEAPRTCDFIAEPDYAYGYFGFKVQPINNNGIVGGQSNVEYLWQVDGGLGTKKSSGTDAFAQYNGQGDRIFKITMRATMSQTGCECKTSKTFTMNRASNKMVETLKPTFKPNPSNGHFYIEGLLSDNKSVKVTLYNISGQAVWETATVSNGNIQVNVDNLSAGVYTIRVDHNQNSYKEKIVITK
jgi:PKD repeat protein